MLPVGVKLSCLLTLGSCGGKRRGINWEFSCSGGFWRAVVGQCLSPIHRVSCPVILGSEQFLPPVTELHLSGFRLLIFFQDYSRNFLFLELISLSGGRGYYRYGHILWLLSLEKNKTTEFSEPFECVSDYCSKNWAAATVPISCVISIKGCKSIANFTSLLVPFLCWENPLVKDLAGSEGRLQRKHLGVISSSVSTSMLCARIV